MTDPLAMLDEIDSLALRLCIPVRRALWAWTETERDTLRREPFRARGRADSYSRDLADLRALVAKEAA